MIFQMRFIRAALAGDVTAKWQTAYQGRIAAGLSKGGQLMQELLESRLRGSYQAT